MTTRSSEALERAASCGCLGGEENIPQGIRGMEIMFGEFIGKNGEHWGEAERVRKRSRTSFLGLGLAEGVGRGVDGGSSIKLDDRTAGDISRDRKSVV